MKRLATGLLLAAVAAGGCAPMPPDRGPGRPGEQPEIGTAPAPRSGMSAAGRSLLIQSMNERRSGNYAQASATLERALRIDPAEPAVWLELARVRLLEGNYVQAEQLGRKAQSLATDDADVALQSVQVIADALRKQGRGREAELLQEQ